MDREQHRPRWREGPPRGYDYHERQVARERSDFPAAKRGRREDNPAYPSYRDVSPAPGPVFPAAPRDRYEAYPPAGIARGRGMQGRGYGRMPEARRAAYPGVKPPGVRPPPPARTVWPAPEPRDFRDAPNRPGQFYPQHEPSPTPSPRSWQGAPHGMDPTHSQGPMSAAHPAPRYGSPAHFDPTAPGPRDGGHLANSMRFQEEAERRPSPRSRPWSRGPSMDRAWQQPQMRGSGPGSGPASYGPGPQGGPRPLMNTGPPRHDLSYNRYAHNQALPAAPMGPGTDARARPGSAPGRNPYSRAGQDRSGSGPRDRGFPHGRVTTALPRLQEPPPAPPAGSGPAVPPPNRTPERSQRSSGARDGSRDSVRERRRDGSRDTGQRGHSSSSWPSRAATGATAHSPMRSSGASREQARKPSGRFESPPKSRLSAPQFNSTAAASQAAESTEPSTALPDPPAAPKPPSPTPIGPADLPSHMSKASTGAHASSGASTAAKPAASMSLDAVSRAADFALSQPSGLQPLPSGLLAGLSPGLQPSSSGPSSGLQTLPSGVPSGLQPLASGPQPQSSRLSSGLQPQPSLLEVPTAEPAAVMKLEEPPAVPSQVAIAPGQVHPSPSTEEPPLKRPKLQFGKGLASRMSSAAQGELTLPEAPVSTAGSTATDSQPAETQSSFQAELKTQAQALEGPQHPAGTPERAQAEQLKMESESPAAAVVATLEALLAQNSPESLSKSSWVQIHRDLQSLNTHKTRLQESIKEYSQQEQKLTQQVEKAQAQRETELRQQQEQQREQQQQRAQAQEEESQIAAQLAQVQADIARLQTESEQVPVLSDVSYNEEEDPEISSSDEPDSESESDAVSPRAAGQPNRHNPGGLARAADFSASLPASKGRLLSLRDTLQRLQPDNGAPALLPDNLMYLLHHEQHVNTILQVNIDNQAVAKEEHHNAVGKHLPEGFQPATEPLDIQSMPMIKQIQEDYALAKPAMLRHLAQRKRLVLAKQLEIASRYNAEFERLHEREKGRAKPQSVEFTLEERTRIQVAQQRIRNQVQIPDQILDLIEKRHSIFVDRNNQYDLREAREAEQASLQLNEADQAKFGRAFTKFPKKWGKIAEMMGDRSAFECAMIYNDQKDSDWFRPTLSRYGRTKRRDTGNRQQRFLSSATAGPPRPESADKPSRGRVTTVVATAVTSQAPAAMEAPPRPGRGKGRGAAAKGPGKGPALRGRPSQRTGGMTVAAAVLTATEGEEVSVLDTATAATSEAGVAPAVSRARYEFDLPWTQEEEQKLIAADSMYPGNVRAIALHVGSRTQKAVRAHLKKMDADRAAAELHQRQAGGAGLRLGQAGAGPGQGDNMVSEPEAAVDEGLGTLETVERLEGSPIPEDRPDQPLHPGREHHWDGQGYAQPAGGQISQQQADTVRFTESLLPEWTAAASSPYPGAMPQALPQGSVPGTLPPAVAPMFFQSQPPLHPSQLVALNPALLQYLLTHLNQPQQPHAQQLPQIHPMLNYQQFMQQMQAATSMAANPGAYPPPNFGAMPSLMHGALGLAAGVQQPLLPGHFGLLQPQGPSQQPLHPMEGVSEGFPLVMPGPSLTDHPIMQPPIVLEQAHQGAGQNAEWPPGALQGVPVQEQNEDGTNRSSPPPSGMAEQPMADDGDSQADPQESTSQGQQEAALALRADSAPGSSTGPDGPPSVSKGARQGGSRGARRASSSGPKRQMNFWQEDEKTAFINAYKMHGVDWETLAKEIPTKEKTQIKNYYQNYKQRLELDQIELPLSAKHPKPNRSRGPGGDASRAATPSRPGSARGSSRQGSENGDRIQAMMDEAVEAAREAATEAAAAAGQGDATDMDTDHAVGNSDGALPGRDSNDSQLRGASPDAAAVMPVEGLSSSPTRLTHPSARVTPPPSRLTPPPSSLGLGADVGWGLADRLRQAWVGGSLVPHASLQTDPSATTLTLAGPPGVTPQGGLPRQGAPTPRPRTAGAFHEPITQQVPAVGRQVTPERQSPSPLQRLSPAHLQMQEEDPQQMAHQANEAEARQGTLLAALPSAAASQDQDSAPVPVSTAVSVTVSVQDIPALSAPAKQQVPTLLPHSSSSHRLAAQTSSPEPLVPSLLKALSQAQGKAHQPSAGLLQTHVQPHVDHLDPFIQTQAESQSQAQSQSEHHASRDDATHSVDHPRSPTHHEGVGHDSSGARAGQSGHSAQAFSLASAMAEHFHRPPRTEAERYSLHSAILSQFGSLLSPDSQHSSPQVLPQDICGNAAFPRAAGPSMAGDAADHAAAGPSTAGDAADHAAAGPSMAGDAADRTVAGPISAGDEASPQDSGQQPERGESGAGGSVVDRLIRNKFDSLSGAPHTAEPSPSADDAAAPVAHSQAPAAAPQVDPVMATNEAPVPLSIPISGSNSESVHGQLEGQANADQGPATAQQGTQQQHKPEDK